MPKTVMRKGQEQVDKFREAARELETDDSEERFDRIVKDIAKSLSKDKGGGKKPE